MAGQNNFIIDLIAALDKVRSKLQIQTDIKSLGDLYVSLIGNLLKLPTPERCAEP